MRLSSPAMWRPSINAVSGIFVGLILSGTLSDSGVVASLIAVTVAQLFAFYLAVSEAKEESQ